MLVTFVIPTLNEAPYLARCVQSIRRLTRPSQRLDADILVVDSGSTDQTLAVAKSLGLRVLEARGATVARARNVGARSARGDVLAFVDADCELPAEWLLQGIEHLQRPGVAAVGTSLLAPPATATWVERHWHVIMHAARHEPYEFVQWLPTSNLLVWREAFRAVDGFNEALVTCEDCDFGYRLARRHTLVLEHRVRTRHLRESRTVPEFFARERWRGLGNLPSWRLHALDRSELWSVLGPLSFVGLILALIVTAIGAPVHYRPLLLALETIAIGLIPWLMLLKKGVRARIGLASFVSSYVLACVYLSARGVALIDHRKTITSVARSKAHAVRVPDDRRCAVE